MKQSNDRKLLLEPEPIPEPPPSGNQKAGVSHLPSGVRLNNHLKIKLNFASPFINSGQLLKYQVLGGGQWLSLVWALLVVQEVLAPGTVTHTGPSQVLGLMQESGSLWVFLARPALYSQSCVCVCIVGRRVMFWAPGSPASPAMVSPIWVPPSILPLAPGAERGRCREMERGWEEGALATSRAAS